MKIGIIIPDRQDRPELLQNCLSMMAAQTLQPDQICVADWPAISNDCDITWRYRSAYTYFEDIVDVILFIENDDYYSPDYIQTMIDQWTFHGKPEIFGTNYTIYYHIGILKWCQLDHFKRASAMNTLIVPKIHIKWPADNEPYTDMYLWRQLNGITFRPKKIISIGIKHGMGKSGGHYHTTKLERYSNDDPKMSFLEKNMCENSFLFYKQLHEKIQGSAHCNG